HTRSKRDWSSDVCSSDLLPTPQFAARLAPMRKPIGSAADSNLLIDIEATGHLLSAPRGLDHFVSAIRTAKADVVVLDPLYSTHEIGRASCRERVHAWVGA